MLLKQLTSFISKLEDKNIKISKNNFVSVIVERTDTTSSNSENIFKYINKYTTILNVVYELFNDIDLRQNVDIIELLNSAKYNNEHEEEFVITGKAFSQRNSKDTYGITINIKKKKEQ